MRRAALLLCAELLPACAAAQGYRVRVDTRWQTVAYRGVTPDSVAASDTVSSDLGPLSPDGYLVRCVPGAPFCSFFRPGPIQRGGPLTASADVTLWGLGVTGLSVRAAGRAGFDLGNADVWPGTDPAFQLLEGYAEYAVPRATARLGRQVIASRLGTMGFDGALGLLRDARLGLELQAYGGWGLARGTALPVSSPVLNPLDDFQPRQRQILAGVAGGWTSSRADARVEYQREVDPEINKFTSEQLAVDAAVRPFPDLRLSAGADYDIAFGWWGSAEAMAAYVTPKVRGTLGVRRYRPHFDLWTIWGAFSPVPYHSIQSSVAVAARPWLEVRGRYERYRYDEAETETPLFSAKRDGWRGELGFTATVRTDWTFDGGYQREFGPGASLSGGAFSASYQPSPRLRTTLLLSGIDRPLEFRFNDAAVRALSLDGQYLPSERVRLSVTVQRYEEEHRRPDAAGFDWGQFRASARVSFAFGSGTDMRDLPPAIKILPGGRSAR